MPLFQAKLSMCGPFVRLFENRAVYRLSKSGCTSHHKKYLLFFARLVIPRQSKKSAQCKFGGTKQ